MKPDCLNCPAALNPKTKCCTYHPFIPNYLVGQALNDQRTEGVMRAYIKNLAPGRRTLMGIAAGREVPNDHFGKNETDLCGLFQNGLCGIWPYRPAVCENYWCIERDESQLFEMNQRENTRAFEALLSLGYTHDDLGVAMSVTEFEDHCRKSDAVLSQSQP